MSQYSNVAFPEKPEYDETGYPCGILVFCFREGENAYYEARLYYSATPFCYDNALGRITNPEGVSHKQTYSAESGTWSEEALSEDAAIGIKPGISGTECSRIWSDHTILDSNGDVFLRAGVVTEAEWPGLKSWLVGLAMGLAGKPLGYEGEVS